MVLCLYGSMFPTLNIRSWGRPQTPWGKRPDSFYTGHEVLKGGVVSAAAHVCFNNKLSKSISVSQSHPDGQMSVQQFIVFFIVHFFFLTTVHPSSSSCWGGGGFVLLTDGPDASHSIIWTQTKHFIIIYFNKNWFSLTRTIHSSAGSLSIKLILTTLFCSVFIYRYLVQGIFLNALKQSGVHVNTDTVFLAINSWSYWSLTQVL